LEFEQQLWAMLAAQTERDQRLTLLTDELALKSDLLEQAEANAAEATKRAELVVELERQLSAMLAAQTRRDQRLAQLTDELALTSALLEQAEANAASAMKRTGLEHANRLVVQVEQKDAELVDMQAKLDELLLSRDQRVRALEQALQKATPRAADADERSRRACEQIAQHETELGEVRAELEARKSELEAARSRLADAENGWAKSRSEADTLRAMTAAGPVSTDEGRITRGLAERMRAMEAEMVSLRFSEKSSEAMQSRNEG
jgi:non-ribosomal peptide synthetase component E (peptide arylation enzyme)